MICEVSEAAAITITDQTAPRRYDEERGRNEDTGVTKNGMAEEWHGGKA